VPQRVVQPVQRFLHQEAASGIVLLAATIVALVWANLDPSGYASFWNTTIAVSIGDWGHAKPLTYVVNDGLMVLFFFVIGLEVKRELAVGELSDRRAAILPLLAALGGMLVPATIFLAATSGSAESVRQGWGVPMATDIAFALGVLALLGSRVPAALKVLLLGIAVIDDIGAIIVIAIFYSGGVDWQWLVAAIAGLLVVVAMQRVHVRSLVPYVFVGLFVWLATFESGVHATIAGVALGLLTPARPYQRGDAVSEVAKQVAEQTHDDPEHPDKDAREWRELGWMSTEAVSPLTRLETALHPWTSAVVLPIFALANVGVVFDAEAAREVLGSGLALGIALGLVLGKPLGVVAGTWIAVRTGLGQLPHGVRWMHVTGAGALAGIGFTMSLFVTSLAFSDPGLIKVATLAVLGASVVAGGIGAALLVRAGNPEDAPAEDGASVVESA
jgi:NhaA family Na+:H+ antiporter